jgi:hypothetical protein
MASLDSPISHTQAKLNPKIAFSLSRNSNPKRHLLQAMLRRAGRDAHPLAHPEEE